MIPRRKVPQQTETPRAACSAESPPEEQKRIGALLSGNEFLKDYHDCLAHIIWNSLPSERKKELEIYQKSIIPNSVLTRAVILLQRFYQSRSIDQYPYQNMALSCYSLCLKLQDEYKFYDFSYSVMCDSYCNLLNSINPAHHHEVVYELFKKNVLYNEYLVLDTIHFELSFDLMKDHLDRKINQFFGDSLSVESHSKVEQWLKIFEGIVVSSPLCCKYKGEDLCAAFVYDLWKNHKLEGVDYTHNKAISQMKEKDIHAILNEWNEWRAKIDHCKQSKYYTETNYKKVLEENDQLSAFPETFHSSFLEFNYHFDVPKSGLLYQNVTDPYTSNESSVLSNQNTLKRRRVLASEPPPPQQQQSNNASMPNTVNRNRRVLMSSSTSSRPVLGSASSTRHLL